MYLARKYNGIGSTKTNKNEEEEEVGEKAKVETGY
jgi:hypothetical protein